MPQREGQVCVKAQFRLVTLWSKTLSADVVP